MDAAAERWDGRIDVLVNNAGIDHDQAFLDFEHERWQAVIGVNLTGPFLMSQAVGRVMAKAGGGAIVHISSIDALGADGTQVAYNASKAGLLGLNRTMAMELAPHGIRSNVVNPGYTATPLTRQYVGEKMYEYMTTSFARVPQGRMATPEEIAARRRLPRLRRRRRHHRHRPHRRRRHDREPLHRRDRPRGLAVLRALGWDHPRCMSPMRACASAGGR